MPSFIYNSCPRDMASAAINFDSDSIKCLLVSGSYIPNKDTHTKRSDITSEITGQGYTSGGAAVVVTVTLDTVNDRVDISLGAVSWLEATIRARGAVYYISRGNETADELIAFIDFNGDVFSNNTTFTLGSSTIRLQN